MAVSLHNQAIEEISLYNNNNYYYYYKVMPNERTWRLEQQLP
jgi:hypothetical protein